MAYVCKECNKTERKVYWGKPLAKPKFLKIMLGDYVHRMKVPISFVERSQKPICSPCTLTTASGCVWNVDVVHGENGVFFTGGWEMFVRDQGIDLGYILVFEQIAQSCFDVAVFDPTCCEVERTHFVRYGTHQLEAPYCGSMCHGI